MVEYSHDERSRGLWPINPSALVLCVLTVGLLVTLGVRFASTIDELRKVEEVARERANDAVLLERLLSTLVDAETGQRGYLLTGDADYLAPYHAAKSRVPALSRRVALSEQPGLNAERFAEIADAKLAELAETIDLAGDDRMDEALAIVRGNLGRDLMEELRAAANAAAVESEAAVEKAVESEQRQYETALVSLTSLTLIGAAAVVVGFYFLTRQLAKREASERRVQYWSSRVEALAELTPRIAGLRDVESVRRASLEESRRLVPAMSTLLVEPHGDGVPARVSFAGSPVAVASPVLEKVAAALADHGAGRYDAAGLERAAATAGLRPEDVSAFTGVTDSVMAVSLGARSDREDKAPAVMVALAASGHHFSADDLLLFRQYAAAVGTAALNARLNEQVAEATERKDDFLAMLGHELRNPLSAIRSAMDAVLRPGGSEDAGELLAVVDRQTTQMRRLVDDLLDVARVARGKVRLEREPLNLAALARTTAADVAAAAGRSADLQLQAGEAVPVSADRQRLEQCVANLVHNACKFSPGGTPIRVRVAGEGGEAVLSVSDAGIGIDPADLGEIFDTFRQTSVEISRTAGGLGLGLSVVQGLIRLHGGRVEARSDGTGRGAEFLIRLPLTSRPLTDGPAQTSPHDLTGTRVLAIDDAPDVLLPVRVLLSKEGCTVWTAADGEEGLKAARDRTPDVILCDVGLPGPLDGFAVVKKLRESEATRRTYTVAVTGYGQPADREESRRAGFDYHLTKPVSRDDLVRVVGERPRFPDAAGEPASA